jgi:hypothetical protein
MKLKYLLPLSNKKQNFNIIFDTLLTVKSLSLFFKGHDFSKAGVQD